MSLGWWPSLWDGRTSLCPSVPGQGWNGANFLGPFPDQSQHCSYPGFLLPFQLCPSPSYPRLASTSAGPATYLRCLGPGTVLDRLFPLLSLSNITHLPGQPKGPCLCEGFPKSFNPRAPSSVLSQHFRLTSVATLTSQYYSYLFLC